MAPTPSSPKATRKMSKNPRPGRTGTRDLILNQAPISPDIRLTRHTISSTRSIKPHWQLPLSEQPRSFDPRAPSSRLPTPSAGVSAQGERPFAPESKGGHPCQRRRLGQRDLSIYHRRPGAAQADLSLSPAAIPNTSNKYTSKQCLISPEHGQG